MCVNKKVGKCGNASSHKLQPHFAVFYNMPQPILFFTSFSSSTSCLEILYHCRQDLCACVWQQYQCIETRLQRLCGWGRRSAFSSSSVRLFPPPPPPPPPLPLLLWKLISSDVTKLRKPWAEVLQMLCHHAKHGRGSESASTALQCSLGKGEKKKNRQRCSASPPPVWLQPLSLIFNYNRQTALRLPRSAGLVLTKARENGLVGEGWQGGREKASDGCWGGNKFLGF